MPAFEAALDATTAASLDEVAHARVPFVALALAPIPTDQREDFTANLDRAIAKAFDEEAVARSAVRHAAEDPDFVNSRTNEAGDPVTLDAACIACRGECCTLGAVTHAFIGPRTIGWYRRSRPEATPQSARADYLSHVPDTRLSGSCVYHGEMGCVLPRDMRASVCNAFSCWARQALAAELDARGWDRSIAVAVPRDHLEHPGATGRPLRTVVVEGDVVTLRDGPPLLPL